MDISAPELLHRLALALTPGVDASIMRRMREKGVETDDYFILSGEEYAARVGTSRGFTADKRDKALALAEKQLRYLQRSDLYSVLFYGDADYPRRLLDIDNAPAVLFKYGAGSCDAAYSAAVVGTRKASPYGRRFAEEIVEAFVPHAAESVIISGLAIGADAAAHAAAVKHKVPTVAVMAHGLHRIYPTEHRELARGIIESGGALLSEQPFGREPLAPLFISRNRIIAALADVTVVVESGIKGGSLHTANYAHQYHRKVAVLPGRLGDTLSAGCNLLVRTIGAEIITEPGDVACLAGISPEGIKEDTACNNKQKILRPHAGTPEALVVDILWQSGEAMNPDAIARAAAMPIFKVIPLLTKMEIGKLIDRYPGNFFRLAPFVEPAE